MTKRGKLIIAAAMFAAAALIFAACSTVPTEHDTTGTFGARAHGPTAADIASHPATGIDEPIATARASSAFWSRWGDGKAEISGYRIETSRYGEPRQTLTRSSAYLSDAAADVMPPRVSRSAALPTRLSASKRLRC